MILGRIADETPPAATDIENAHAWFQLDLPADEFQFRLLGSGEIDGLVVPIGTAVGHVFVEHAFKEIIADIIMLSAHFQCLSSALAVGEGGFNTTEKSRP